MNFELQLFDNDTGCYVPVEPGDNPRDLMALAKGMTRRVVGLWRGTNPFNNRHTKPLPLKPRIPYGLSGKHRKRGKNTMIEPPSTETMTGRIMEYYEPLAMRGSITIHLWRDSPLNHFMRCRFRNMPNVTLLYVDNEVQP